MKLGTDAASSTPQEFGTFVKQEIAKWTKVVATAEITSE